MIKLADCLKVAEDLGVEPEIILAVAGVESNKDINAFLFEPHKFSEFTQRRYDRSHPNISYPSWDRSRYPKSKLAKQLQFDEAVSVAPLAAYAATSWGLFQIMGFHYKLLGYSSPTAMAIDLKAGIEQNMTAFGKIIKDMNLVQVLKDKNWTVFARRYNGPGYIMNNYDERMANNYKNIIIQSSGARA